MSDDDALRREIATDVVRFIASAVLHNHGVAQRLGLGPSDSQFLTLLQRDGPLTPGRLAELSGLTTGTVTGVIDRLEKAGFVRRDRDASDRRKIVVRRDEEALTSRVQPEYAKQGAALDAVLRDRTAAELEAIARFFGDLLGPTRTPDRPAPTPPDARP